MPLDIRKIKNKEELEECFKIRKIVFVNEQKVPETMELDEFEDSSDHYVCAVNNAIIGTARTRFIDNSTVKIERVMILKEHREKGFGKDLMEKIMQNLQEDPKVKQIKLHAQLQVKDFYTIFGFEEIGEVFEDAGILHIEMVCKK